MKLLECIQYKCRLFVCIISYFEIEEHYTLFPQNILLCWTHSGNESEKRNFCGRQIWFRNNTSKCVIEDWTFVHHSEFVLLAQLRTGENYLTLVKRLMTSICRETNNWLYWRNLKIEPQFCPFCCQISSSKIVNFDCRLQPFLFISHHNIIHIAKSILHGWEICTHHLSDQNHIHTFLKASHILNTLNTKFSAQSAE